MANGEIVPIATDMHHLVKYCCLAGGAYGVPSGMTAKETTMASTKDPSP